MSLLPSSILGNAATLIRSTDWTQHTDARDKDGNPVSALDAAAACFCGVGALKRAAGREFDVNPMSPLRRALEFFGGVLGGIAPKVNDEPGMTKERILAKLEEARAVAVEAEQQEGGGL